MNDLERILALQRQWQAAADEGAANQRKLANEALDRCNDALHILVDHLNQIGYPWARMERVDESALNQNVEQIETTLGAAIPEILVLFWQKVGGVSLVDLENYRHVDFWEDHGISLSVQFCDGLVVEPCSRAWADFICDDFKDWDENWPPDDPQPFLLSLSPDGYHKDNISGGSPYGLFVGEAWMPVWQYFEWPGIRQPESASNDPPDFLSYLRTTILECAGFPGLFGEPAFDALRERILKGVPLF